MEHIKKSLLGTICVAILMFAITSSASAGTVLMDTWYEFGYTIGSATPLNGCSAATCVTSSNPSVVFASNPPWTFNATNIVSLLVTDGFDYGDQLAVYDFGTLIGSTLFPSTTSGYCGSDPDACFADPNSSSGTFALAAGAHSLTFVTSEPTGLITNGGASFFQVSTTVVPEPSSILLSILGLAMLGFIARRKRTV